MNTHQKQDILKRNAELEKEIALKNRELEIEAALERVRARTMAMQRSDELPETSFLLFQQVKELGETTVQNSIGIVNEEAGFVELSTTVQGHHLPHTLHVPIDDPYVMAKAVAAWKAKRRSLKLVFEGQELKDYNEHRNSFFETKVIFPEDQWIVNIIFFSKGWISFSSDKNISDETFELLKRFAAVFEQTYTRFNDLKQAEAQAREAEIELGLERVRTRAMAMQNSSELSQLVDTVFKELTKLDFALTWCIINIIDEPSMSNTVWAANPDINKAPESYHMLFEDYPFHHAMMNGWKERNAKCVYTIEGTEKKVYDEYLFKETEFRKVPEEAQAASRAMEKYVVSFSFSNFGGLQTVGDAPLSDANLDILSRFGKVFDLTYTRFNDLKQAEAQARESQIQLALERVRARTMAMQHSDELKEAAALLFQQAKALGVPAYSCGYNIWEKNDTTFTSWMSTQDGSDFNGVPDIPLTEDANFIRYVESKQKGEQFFVLELRDDRMQEHYEYLKTIPAFKAYFDYAISVGFDLPETQIHHLANFSQGNLLFITLEPCPEFHDVFKRFAAVFEQTYTRFLDLQKAEAQARESQIQLALERVRARTMAMQKSEELADVSLVLFQQVEKLGFKTWATGFNIWLEGNTSYIDWVVNSATERFMEPYTVDLTAHPLFIKISEAKRRGDDFFVLEFEGESLVETYRLLFSMAKLQFEQVIESGFQMPSRQINHYVFGAEVSLMFITYEPYPEAHDIFKRFGKVFEQTYTRFLDLQKAEAQAREARIENALEKVRSRTMAMQRSEELPEAANNLFLQVQALGIPAWSAGYCIWDEDKKGITLWMSSEGVMQPSAHAPCTEDPSFIHMREAYERGDAFHVEEIGGEALVTHYKYMRTLPVVGEILDSIIAAGHPLPTFQIFHCVYFSQGFLLFITYEKVPEAHIIFKRFTNVFEQTYTRFLDLQKAEAQAREAKIEAALEKVRSRTMAMQRSAELAEVATVLFQQVKALGVPQWTCGFSIFEIDDKEFTWYPGGPGGEILPPCKIPLTEHPVFISFNESRKRGDELYIYEKTGEEQADHYRYMCSLPGVGEYMQSRLDAGEVIPAFQIDHLANFSHGNLVFITYEHFPEMHDVFKRFAKVFDQTYTRFLDLQKAEAQAREAQIEAALERIRSRTMAMQKSDELTDVAGLLFAQVSALGIKTWTAGFNVWSEDNDSYIDYITSPNGGFIEPYTVYTETAEALTDISDARKSGVEFDVQYVEGEKIKQLYRALTNLGEKQFEIMLQDGVRFPSHQYEHFVFGSKVSLMFITYEPVPEAHDIFKRLGKVFEQTYTRFLDLQKAEAQAREAIKQASVDRVRAEIASMRTTNDLERITPLIWNELKTLGVPFMRCGVFIIDEEQQQVHTFLSTPDGKANASFTSAITTVSIVAEALPYWRRKEMYKAHWDEATFIEQTKHLVEQGAVSPTNTYLTENRPKNLYLNLLPFLQGILYVGNDSPLNEDELQLVQNLADAFAIAYARYEDFNKLELAKEQIEKTLVDLKLTQAQLVQSEKMASLGELTAGIAHEIQNPLNFVNNFSDVNTELIDELKAELATGNMQLANEIADDIRDNEQKINHHGKRADAIVKGMLQHSRSSSGIKEPTDINVLADEYLRLAYHGLRAKDKFFNATMKTDFDNRIDKVNIIPQEIGRVILNLITNAFYVVAEKKKQLQNGYEPTVTVTTKKEGDKVFVSVKDNGNGIPQKILDKIFQPFFTTKPTGQGTGLGLSLSYDIVKAHSGEIKVETNEGEGTEFIIQLPIGQ